MPKEHAGSGVGFGGLLQDGELFDCRAFCISPVEAAAMDPQQRLLLELGYESFLATGLRFRHLPCRRRCRSRRCHA